MNNKCWMESEVKQCCCTCAYHWEDHLHCTHDRHLTFDISTLDEQQGCICNIQRGWICANPEFYPHANSNWPEHSIGCECYTNRDELQDLIIKISGKNGVKMTYVVSGEIADEIMEMDAKERKSAEVKDA